MDVQNFNDKLDKIQINNSHQSGIPKSLCIPLFEITDAQREMCGGEVDVHD